MRVLILGGTIFLGRHLVDAALDGGHDVTLFHRGRHPSHRRADVEELLGDRDGGLHVLRGRRWDVAVDTNGYLPQLVAASGALLAPAVEHLTLVSSCSVYADLSPGVDGDRPVHEPLAEGSVTEHYGPLKVGCERAAEAAMPGRVLHQRAGLIVGPYDPGERLTYWARRIAAGGDVLAPAPADQPVQFIDARDLAAWTIEAAERRLTGVVNAVGPRGALTLGSLLDRCRAVTGSGATLTWVDGAFLEGESVEPWTDLPLWLPEHLGVGGMLDADDTRARELGLTARPVDDTIRDTLADAGDRPPPRDFGTGLTPGGLDPDRETALLAAWRLRA